MPRKLQLKDLDVKGKKVLVRVDFNVPLDKELHITDNTRIAASLPTITYLLEKGAQVILMSHLGRPKGKVNSKLSLAPCAKELSKLLNRPIHLTPSCIGEDCEKIIDQAPIDQPVLLENLRFHIGEEDPQADPLFVHKLAKLGDIYVNDAFGTAHRSHASTAVIASHFPNASAAGFLLDKEIQFLGTQLRQPKKPFFAIIGGAKVSSKIKILKSLLNKVDGLIIGGGMAYTFYAALNLPTGDSLCEQDLVPEAKALIDACHEKGVQLILPLDNVAADCFSNDAKSQIYLQSEGIPPGMMGLDIGPQTIDAIRQALQPCKTILWNGPLGVTELPNFAQGTRAIAQVLADTSAQTIIGGGDSVAAIKSMNLDAHFTHISTGGGAALEYIENGSLPGIEALSEVMLIP